MINYKELITKLKPVLDKVFYLSLSETEIQELESKTGKVFPAYYRDFLKHFGQQQDLVSGLFSNKYSFIEYNEELQNSDGLENYLMIGDNDGEDFWMIRIDEPKDLTIYNWVNDEIEITGLTFLDLLENSVYNRLDSSKTWETNDQKTWFTQFSIQTNDEELIYSTIPLKRSTDWSFNENYDSGVNSYLAVAELMNKEIPVTKLTHASWKSTIYIFNWDEPINVMRQKSNIKDWENALSQHFEDFKLIDFGIFTSNQFPQELQ